MEAKMKISENALLYIIHLDFYSIPFPILRDEFLILGKGILRMKLTKKFFFSEYRTIISQSVVFVRGNSSIKRNLDLLALVPNTRIQC